MKTSSIIITVSFVVGISIISALVIMNPPTSSTGAQISFTAEKSHQQQYWEDYAKRFPNIIIINETREIEERPFVSGDSRIEINRLKLEYVKDEPINFEVLVIGDGSACASIWVSISREFEDYPPIYFQDFVSICDGSHLNYLAVPISLSINTENNSILHLDPGEYVLSTSYYQHRGSFGDTRQEFIIK